MRINAAEGNLEKQGLFTSVENDEKITQKTEGKGKAGRNIYAGNMASELDFDSKIAQKRKQAQNQAMKFVSDVFEKDSINADMRDKLRQLHQDKAAELQQYDAEIVEIEESKKDLMEQYGVSPDSQEQKDLELLERYQDRINGVSFDRFSEEELDRLRELQSESRTEYQNRVLELNQRQGIVKGKANDLREEVRSLYQNISQDKIDEEKNQEMLKAEAAKEELLKASEKEIVGMYVEHVKENVDDKAAEEQEKAEKLEEKREEREEQIEEQREDRKEQEEMLKNIAQSNKLTKKLGNKKTNSDSFEVAQRNIKRIVRENSLIDDDLKGIEIDFGF